MIKALIIDRDGTCVHNSTDPASPFYYILKHTNLVLKPNVFTAFSVLDTIRRHTDLKIYLATKQRCIDKGLITSEQVEDINRELERKLDFVFDGIYIEKRDVSKRDLFAAILRETKVEPQSVVVIDDSINEMAAAESLGLRHMRIEGTLDLYTAISRVFP